MIIGQRHIGSQSPTVVIAEIGVNHDGSLSRALQLVQIAHRCGADAVKLQVFQADQLMHASSHFAAYQRENVNDADPVAMLKRYELDEAELKTIVNAIHAAGMLAVATAFSPGDVETIMRLGIDAFKIASPDAVNRLLLQKVAETQLPMIVSTGASSLDEIHMCCDWLKTWGANYALLHCISSYPTPAEMTHLCWINELKAEFGVDVGFSDHSTEVITGALAVAAGASIVERHLTYSHAADGPDHAASSDPGEFSQYARLIHQAERMIGSPGKRVLAIEQDVRQVSRQSLVCRRDLAAGQVISPDDLTVQRPGTGIPAAMIESTVGKKLVKPVKAGSMLNWDMFAEAAYMARSKPKRNVTFVTGTRAEFGLMQTTLDWLSRLPRINLQIVATGMHLSVRHGSTLDEIRKRWKIDQMVPWPATVSEAELAAATGKAIDRLTGAFESLKTDIVLIVGDRVEAFAAATAGHLSGRVVAHIHGGDRAQGQVDDTLRHTITKLSHVHFPATRQSAQRILRLGEDHWRIHTFGTPGIDGISTLATHRTHLERAYPIAAGKFGLVLLHPADPDERQEAERAKILLTAMQLKQRRYVIVYPNNDPGSEGIARQWDKLKTEANVLRLKSVPRADFLGLMRDASMLIGNSSSGIIEAASFGTPVIDIGPRQDGREHGANVRHVPYDVREISAAIRESGGADWQVRFPAVNPYGGQNAGKRIARALSSLIITPALRRKLITY